MPKNMTLSDVHLRFPSLIVNTLAEKSELKDGKDSHNTCQYDGHCRTITHAESTPRDFIQVIDDRIGCATRSTSRHDERLTKHLELSDKARDCDKQQARTQQGQRNVKEKLTPIGPVNTSSLVKLFGYCVQPGDKNEHGETKPPPDGGQTQRGDDEVRIAQPVDWLDTQKTKPIIEDSKLRTQ